MPPVSRIEAGAQLSRSAIRRISSPRICSPARPPLRAHRAPRARRRAPLRPAFTVFSRSAATVSPLAHAFAGGRVACPVARGDRLDQPLAPAAAISAGSWRQPLAPRRSAARGAPRRGDLARRAVDAGSSTSVSSIAMLARRCRRVAASRSRRSCSPWAASWTPRRRRGGALDGSLVSRLLVGSASRGELVARGRELGVGSARSAAACPPRSPAQAASASCNGGLALTSVLCASGALPSLARSPFARLALRRFPPPPSSAVGLRIAASSASAARSPRVCRRRLAGQRRRAVALAQICAAVVRAA